MNQAPAPSSAKAGSSKSLLIVTPDRLGERRSGIALRHVELAWALKRAGFEARVASTDPRSRPDGSGLEIALADRKSIEGLCAGADAVMVQGTVLRDLPFLARSGIPTVVDLVCPVFLENLERYRGRPDIHLRLEGDLRVFRGAAAAGDFFLAGSEGQRRFWLGFLAAQGRVNGLTAAGDPNLDRLIGVVPFGVPPEPPPGKAAPLRGAPGGAGKDDFLMLWGGGLWPWMDPLTPLRAVAEASRRLPGLKLLFTGVRHPQEARDSAGTAAAQEEARRLGVLDRSVFFKPGWVPSDEMTGCLLASDVGISAHLRTIEAEFAVRTRVFDYLWCGLPMILTEGDWAAELVAAEGLGFTPAPGDADAWVKAILALSDPAFREKCAAAARRVAPRFSWDRVVEPLASFLSKPEKAGDRRGPSPYSAVPASAAFEDALARILAGLLSEGFGITFKKSVMRLYSLFSGKK